MMNSMSLDKQILYSLIGEPLRQDIGTTIDGHRAYDQINPANPTLSVSFEPDPVRQPDSHSL